MKGQKAIDCVVTPYSMEWIQRYRDLKDIVFADEEEDPNHEFFVNYGYNLCVRLEALSVKNDLNSDEI